MADCVNKNDPEFKKIVRITKLSPEDVSTAIGVWQDHTQSTELPDSITVLNMYANRESYGGMDQYLLAISDPVKKTNVGDEINKLTSKIQNISNSLRSIIPDIKINLHDSQKDYNVALLKASGSEKNQSSKAFYDNKNKEIHLNASIMINLIRAGKSRTINTVEHEATHPILEIIENVSPGATNELYNDLLKIENQLGLDKKYSVKFAGKYKDQDRKTEAVAEFIADVASGEIELRTLKNTERNSIIDFLAKILSYLGIDIKPKINNTYKIVLLANSLQSNFKEGTPISLFKNDFDNKNTTIFNDMDSLSNNEYIVKNKEIRRIESVNSINPIRHSYTWSKYINPGLVYNTIVGRNGDEQTTKIDRDIKYSLSETDNSEDKQSPHQESIKFGNLVRDLIDKIKNGNNDIVLLREEAGVSPDTYEIFQNAYDIAVVRAGKPAKTTRQQALQDLIKKAPIGTGRPSAQSLYRKRKNMLDALRIDVLMLKQILPDESILKDKSLNATWKRILNVIEDVGDYTSQTIARGKKFEITDFEGNETGYWDHAALGFSDMIAYVQNAVESDPDNKEKLLSNVRESLKNNGDDDMLKLLEVAIAASGETNINDLSKIVRAGSLAGRVLNVIKRYIGGQNFGRVKTDLAAATVMAENDALLEKVNVGEDMSGLQLSEEIRALIELQTMSKEEREQFIEDNPELIKDIEKFIKRLKIPLGYKPPSDTVIIRRANSKISKGILSLTSTLRRTNPELVKFSKTDLDKEAIKSIKQVLRGLIDLHGTDKNMLIKELDKLFISSDILLDANEVLSNPGIQNYIENADRHSIRSGVIQSMGLNEDNYSKMILDHILKVINVPEKGQNKIELLTDALDRGELTKEILDTVIAQINEMPDEEKKARMLEIIDRKFSMIFDSAIQSKTLSEAISKGIGDITKQMVSDYIQDPERSLAALALTATNKLGLTPDQANEWAAEITKKVKEKLDKARKTKIKSLLKNKVQDKKKAEQVEEKILKIISTTAKPDGSIPSVTEVDEQMLDIKQIVADKYDVKLNDPKAIANIIRLTNLLRVARTQSRRDQIHAEIMLRIKNMRLSPNKYMRRLKSGILEMPNFVMANILSATNSAFKALIGGLYNSTRAYIDDALIGRGLDWYYNGRALTNAVISSLKEKNDKSPATHLALTYRLFYDVMRNGSAAISQANIPEHGLSNFDNTLNHSLALRSLYANFRFLSAIDRATMNLNHNRLAYRKAINSLHEFGKNNVMLDGQMYSRTAGGAAWYKVLQDGTPEVDPSTGNIKTIYDKRTIQILSVKAKENFSQIEFITEAERLLGFARIDEIHKGIIDEWNSLVDLYNSDTAGPDEKLELKRLALNKSKLVKVNTMDDFKSMSGAIKRFVSLEIYKKVEQNQNAALSRKVHMEAGSYSAQGTEIPGAPAGLLYDATTSIDRMIESSMKSNNLARKYIGTSFGIAVKLYAALITKAPAIGFAAALLYSPISFLLNLTNLGFHMAGRPFMRMSYDAKDKVWRYNGLSVNDIKNATGISNVSASDLMFTRNESILSVLKEGYTVQASDMNTFDLKNPDIYTIGGQSTKTEISTILLKQAASQLAFIALVSAMVDCPDDDCELTPLGKKIMDKAIKGWGAMKQWLDDKGLLNETIGYRPIVDKYGDPHHNTVILSPVVGPFQARIPINELNNAIAATTLARIADELKSGVKLTKEDMILRYMIYSNFDLLVDNVDMSVDGLAEIRDVAFSFFDESYTSDKNINKASSSIAKRAMAALTPKMINDFDKFSLDMENKYMFSAEAEGFSEQLKKKIPLNTPFVRRYVTQNDTATYKQTPYQHEWTDWQLYLVTQKEPGDLDQFGLNTGKYILNDKGRITIKAPDGEVEKIKRQAISLGGGEFVDNGYLNLSNYFDKVYQEAIQGSDINNLLDQGKKEEALDLMKTIAEEVKKDPSFTIYKQTLLIPKKEEVK